MEKLKEFFGFIVCLAVILGIARFTGFLGGFSVVDFQEAYYKIANSLNLSSKQSDVGKYISSKLPGDDFTNINANAQVNGYRAIIIPKDIIDASEEESAWRSILSPVRKTVFYIYDDRNNDHTFDMDFHNKIQQFAKANNMREFYNFEMISLNLFNSYAVGEGPNKMCDTIQECNDYRKKAGRHQQMSDFIRRCGRYFCIINPDKYPTQFIILKKRDADEAIKLMQSVKGW